MSREDQAEGLSLLAKALTMRADAGRARTLLLKALLMRSWRIASSRRQRGVRWFAGLLTLAACGRISFDELADATDASRDVAAPDAPCTLGPWSAPVFLLDIPTGKPALSPTITADGLELFGNDSRATERMWVATRTSTSDPFETPTFLASPPGTPTKNYDPSISDNGLTLYFNDEQNGTTFSTRSTRTSPWGPATVLASLPINASPDVSGDQLAMYIDNGADLRVARRTAITDSFGAPTTLPSPVSVPGFNDVFPSISSDELELYFQSDRNGGSHLFVATRTDKAAEFTNATDLAFPAGTYGDPDISSNGLDLYMAATVGGVAGIYVSHRSCQ